MTIEFDPRAVKDLDKLDQPARKRILRFLEEWIQPLDDPRALGESLRGPKLGEYWKYRVSDYRIICKIEDARLVALVLKIGHRREVYRS